MRANAEAWRLRSECWACVWRLKRWNSAPDQGGLILIKNQQFVLVATTVRMLFVNLSKLLTQTNLHYCMLNVAGMEEISNCKERNSHAPPSIQPWTTDQQPRWIGAGSIQISIHRPCDLFALQNFYCCSSILSFMHFFRVQNQ